MRFEMKMPDLLTTDSEVRIVRWLVEPGNRIARPAPVGDRNRQGNDGGRVGRNGGAAGSAIAGRRSGRRRAGNRRVGSRRRCRRPRKSRPREPANRPACLLRNRAATACAGETPAPQAAAGVPLSASQRVAAKRLAESKQTIPHFYLQTSANAAAMVARRKAAAPVKLAWDAFVVSAVARAIGRFDRFRCRLNGERLVPVESAAIGVAVDDGNELFVIRVDSPAAKTVEQISDDICRGAEGVRNGDPESRRIRPALLTVTNLGVCPIESFIPIINPPEAAVLGVGRVMPVPVARDDGQIVVQHRCTLTLSVDHRIVSGRYAGDFLAAIVRELESID